PRNATPRDFQLVYAAFSAGCSSWQGPHHDAQKTSTTGWPRNDVMLTSLPVSVGPPVAVTWRGGADPACAAPQPAMSSTTEQPSTNRRALLTAALPRHSTRIDRRSRTSGSQDRAGQSGTACLPGPTS